MPSKRTLIRNVNVTPMIANTQTINPNIVEVELRYETGEYRPRGYYISASPVFKEGSTTQYSIFSKNFRQYWEKIESAKRFSQKRFDNLFNNLDQNQVNEALNYLVSENDLAIVE